MNITYSPQELADAYAILKVLEGEEKAAYLDTATPSQITIGVGSNIQANATARQLAINAVVDQKLSAQFKKPDVAGNLVIDADAVAEFDQYRTALGTIIGNGDLTKLNNFVHLNNLTATERTQYANLLKYQNLLPQSFTIPDANAGGIQGTVYLFNGL
ncbi:hypothetical protein ACFL19_00660 [Pseudomonadota bacterium]